MLTSQRGGCMRIATRPNLALETRQHQQRRMETQAASPVQNKSCPYLVPRALPFSVQRMTSRTQTYRKRAWLAYRTHLILAVLPPEHQAWRTVFTCRLIHSLTLFLITLTTVFCRSRRDRPIISGVLAFLVLLQETENVTLGISAKYSGSHITLTADPVDDVCPGSSGDLR